MSSFPQILFLQFNHELLVLGISNADHLLYPANNFHRPHRHNHHVRLPRHMRVKWRHNFEKIVFVFSKCRLCIFLNFVFSLLSELQYETRRQIYGKTTLGTNLKVGPKHYKKVSLLKSFNFQALFFSKNKNNSAKEKLSVINDLFCCCCKILIYRLLLQILETLLLC